MTFIKHEGFTFDGTLMTKFGEETASRIVISYARAGGTLPEKYFGPEAEKFQNYLTQIGVEGDAVTSMNCDCDSNAVFKFVLNGKDEFENCAREILAQ